MTNPSPSAGVEKRDVDLVYSLANTGLRARLILAFGCLIGDSVTFKACEIIPTKGATHG